MFPKLPAWAFTTDVIIVSTWISAVSFLMWRTLVRPLQKIAAAAQALGEGNMAARTGVARKDAIGTVARAFDDMSDRIARSRKAEHELLASMSHELRTPLARIRVALDLAAEADAATARESLVGVAEDLSEIETLMANIFSMARLEIESDVRGAQALPLHRAEIDLPGLIEKAVGHQRSQHPQRLYAVEISASAAGRAVYADPVLVRRAVENVLENAHKYSPADSPVTIAVGEQAKGLCIAISDRGFGIGTDDLQRVFSPFFRADRSRTRATGGVGLGLALAKRVVEAHGGSIAIASCLDVGTTVTFVLPVPEVSRRLGNSLRNI